MAEEDRTLTISVDSEGIWSFQTTGFGITHGFSTYERKAKYGNRLVNGQVEVTDARGNVTMMADGCHLVQHQLTGLPEEQWPLQAMSKQDYEAFSQRPGSANED